MAAPTSNMLFSGSMKNYILAFFINIFYKTVIY